MTLRQCTRQRDDWEPGRLSPSKNIVKACLTLLCMVLVAADVPRMCPGRFVAAYRRRPAGWVRGEPACRPGSVHPRGRGPTAIHLGLPLPAASCGLPASIGRAALKRSRRSRAPEGAWALVTLLRVGFTEPPGSLRALVVSYTTVSPLPRAWPKPGPGRSVLCGTVPRVTPGRCYRPPCPVEPGPSSPGHARTARRGRPAGSPFPPRIGACAPRVANSRPAARGRRAMGRRRAMKDGGRHHSPAGPERRCAPLPAPEEPRAAPLPPGAFPRPLTASMASLARRSAWVFRSRGTQV